MSCKMPFRCRIQKIAIDNLRNVSHGVIRLKSNMTDDIYTDSADILGLYGQNGSGKTTLIFALELLKTLLAGRPLWSDIDNYIRVGADSAKLDYVISLESEKYGNYLIKYSVVLKNKKKNEVIDDIELISDDQHYNEVPVYVSEEKLQYKFDDGNKGNRNCGIVEFDVERENTIFGPDTRYKEFVSKDGSLTDELRFLKTAIYKTGASFAFSILKIKNIRERHGFSDELLFIMDSIQMYGVTKLFVLSNVQASIVNANIMLPMSFCWTDNKIVKIMNIIIKLTGESIVPLDIYEMIENRFNMIDKVISKLIPEMSIKVVNRGSREGENKKPSAIIELVSIRNDVEIALRYESDGIKKLIYILYSLIEMFNDPSVTVAIDELDSGIFEYLLGEVLIVLQESAKGQLIFTSHNLRALEVLDKKSVMFSTTNTNNRYIRFKKIKGSNNLRDVYYQDILLGGQEECIYQPTSQSSIRRAFKSAGGDLNG